MTTAPGKIINKMVQVSEGPVSIRPELNDQFDVGFRVLSSYQIQTDSVVTRFDVLINGEIVEPGGRVTGEGIKQFNVSINSTEPGTSSLLLPKGGILGGFVIQTSDKELVAALRGLADAVERECLS